MHNNNLSSINSSKTVSSKIPSVPKKEEHFVDRGVALPFNYGDTKLVLLPRDPHWAYAYWELGTNMKDAIEKKHGKDIWEKSRSVLRVYDVTDINFNGHNAHRVTEISIDFRTGNWYFRVPEQDRHYIGEIGLITRRGKFIALSRSNTIHIPRGKISDIVDEDWMIIKEDFQRLIHRAGLDKTGLGSQTIMRMIMQRIEGILVGPGISSQRGASRIAKKKKK